MRQGRITDGKTKRSLPALVVAPTERKKKKTERDVCTWVPVLKQNTAAGLLSGREEAHGGIKEKEKCRKRKWTVSKAESSPKRKQENKSSILRRH